MREIIILFVLSTLVLSIHGFGKKKAQVTTTLAPTTTTPKITCMYVCTRAVEVLLDNANDVSQVFNSSKNPEGQAIEICNLDNIKTQLNSYRVTTDQCTETAGKYILIAQFKEFIVRKANGEDVNATQVCNEAHLCPEWNSYNTYYTPIEYTQTTTHDEIIWYQRKFLLSSNKDIYIVHRNIISKNNTEVQVLSAASNYETLSDPIVTPLHTTNKWWDFAIAPNNDIFCICKTGCRGAASKMTELLILSAESNYKTFTTTNRIETGQPQTGGEAIDKNYDYQVSANRDLFIIKKQGDEMTEVIVLSATSDYQQISLHAPTALPPTGNAYQFFIHPTTSDLIVVWKDHPIATNPKSSDTTEVHVMLKANNYTTYFTHNPTALHQTDYIYYMFAGVAENWDVYALEMAGTGTKTVLYILRSN